MKAVAQRGRRPSSGLVIGLLAGLGLGISPGPVVLLAVILAPAWLFAIFERTGRRSTAMLFFAAAGAVQPVLTLIHGGLYLDVTWTLLSSPFVLARAWLAAMLGWGLAQTLPELALIVLNAKARTRAAALRRQRDRLRQEWDLDKE